MLRALLCVCVYLICSNRYTCATSHTLQIVRRLAAGCRLLVADRQVVAARAHTHTNCEPQWDDGQLNFVARYSSAG